MKESVECNNERIRNVNYLIVILTLRIKIKENAPSKLCICTCIYMYLYACIGDGTSAQCSLVAREFVNLLVRARDRFINSLPRRQKRIQQGVGGPIYYLIAARFYVYVFLYVCNSILWQVYQRI